MTLSSRERVLKALNLQVPDQVPIFDFLNNPRLFYEVIGVRPEYIEAEYVVPCASKLGLDAFWLPMQGFPSVGLKGTKGEFVDEWGTTYRQDEVSFPNSGPLAYPIKSRNDLKNYTWPDPEAEWRYQETAIASRLAEEKKLAFIAGIRGPFSTASLLMGMQEFCLAFYDQPDVIHEIFKKTTEFFSIAGRKLVENGADVLIVHEDLGSDTNTLISPALYEEFVYPYHQALFNNLNKLGVPIILHSDGNIKKLMNWLIALKINGLHPLQKSAQMDLAEAKKLWGSRLCLIGNVDASTTLAYGTPEAIEREILECLQVAAPGGGYIMASDHSLNVGIPVANALKYLELAHKHCEKVYM